MIDATSVTDQPDAALATRLDREIADFDFFDAGCGRP